MNVSHLAKVTFEQHQQLNATHFDIHSRESEDVGAPIRFESLRINPYKLCTKHPYGYITDRWSMLPIQIEAQGDGNDRVNVVTLNLAMTHDTRQLVDYLSFVRKLRHQAELDKLQLKLDARDQLIDAQRIIVRDLREKIDTPWYKKLWRWWNE